MKNRALHSLLCCLLPVYLSAQLPVFDTVWIQTDNLRLCLRNDGYLFPGSPDGAMQFRQQTPVGEKWLPILREAGLWLGGVDPAGNLKLSIPEAPAPTHGFLPGIEGVNGSGKIWHVTYDQVEEHLRD